MGTMWKVRGVELTALVAVGVLGLLGVFGWLVSSALTATSSSPKPLTKAQAAKAYGKLPLRFEANRGQTDPRAKFIARGAGYTLFLTPQESVVSLVKPAPPRNGGKGPQDTGGRSTSGPTGTATVHMRLAGANPSSQLDGLKRLPGHSNYLTGRDPHTWRTGVPGYASALSRGVYPGIDLLYHGKQGQLEYDFQVAPGADPNRIALTFSGARKLSLDRRGDLLLETPAGMLRQHKPVIYQQIDGRRRSVSGHFVLHARNRVGFRVGAYDRSARLVIDPTLAYSTYLGGSGQFDQGEGIAVDSAGSAYVTGIAGSEDFPTHNAFQSSPKSDRDVFVSKLTPDGTALAYSTFLGGSGDDQGSGIGLDGTGAAYIAGTTSSTDFPVPNAFRSTCPGTQGYCRAAFVAKLKSDGSGLIYSTYLGGNQFETGNAIAVDSAGSAYVTGETGSASFPTQNAAQPTYAGGNSDAFITKLNSNDGGGAVTLAYSTFLGGGSSTYERAHGIALDSSGAAYVTGTTNAAGFPTTAGAYDRTCGTGATTDCNNGELDAFVAKYSTTGAVAYSTLLGGTHEDVGFAIAVGHGGSDAGAAYVHGATTSNDYPTTTGAYDRTCATSPSPLGTTCAGLPGNQFATDAFVTKLNATGSDLVYSTFLGGQDFDVGKGIAVNSAGNVFVSGTAASTDFPIVRPVDEAGSRAYVAEFNGAGSGLVFSTYFGGSAPAPGVSGMALDSAGNAYITGSTAAIDFPTQNHVQGKLATPTDAFVAKFSTASDANLAAPYVEGVSPRGGDVSGGRRVKITGTGFGGASAVAFGGVAAASFTIDSATQITAVAPAHAPGPAPVTVTTSQGTSPPNPISRFIYAEGMFASTDASPVPFSRDGGPPTVTLLKAGKVLVAGAGTRSAALYNPKTGTFTPTGPLAPPKSENVKLTENVATLLPNDKVLVVGDNGAELYAPSAGTFSPTKGPPLFSPVGGTATLLKTGKVLITGLNQFIEAYPNPQVYQAQLYDPVTDTFSATGSPIDDHRAGKAALLPNGKVLLAGGPGPNFGASRSAEVYDPTTQVFTRTGALNSGRYSFTLTPLPNGKILAAGGAVGIASFTASAELYDPQTGDWAVTGGLDDPRRAHAATLLANGKVLITGGSHFAYSYDFSVPRAELFDPAARGGQGGFTSAGRMEDPIAQPGAALLSSDTGGFAADPALCGENCGKVLLTGRANIFTSSSFSRASRAELYTPGVPSSGPGPGGGGPGSGSPPSGGGPGSGSPPSGLTSHGTTGPSDITAPGVSGFGLTNNPFVVGGGSTPTFGSAAKAKKHKKGTTFRYTLSEAATVQFTVSQRASGRRRGRRCVAPTRSLRRARTCTRIIARGTLTRISRQGRNSVGFSGRIGSRRLSPGRYQATLLATDAAGNRSRPMTISFTIVRR